MRRLGKLSFTLALCVLGLLSAPQAAATDADSFRTLAAEWWQWALSIPAPENPLLDSTGAKCMVGQRGPLWFLAGTTGGASVRTCLVPAGEAIFFPVINFVFFNTPNACGQGPESIPVVEMRAIADAAIDGATDISATFDGEPVTNLRRVRSRVFPLALPEENLFAPACAESGGLPAGIYPKAIDDGYYAFLRPLRPGNHTLHFHAEVPEAGFLIDQTYHLIAVPATP